MIHRVSDARNATKVISMNVRQNEKTLNNEIDGENTFENEWQGISRKVIGKCISGVFTLSKFLCQKQKLTKKLCSFFWTWKINKRIWIEKIQVKILKKFWSIFEKTQKHLPFLGNSINRALFAGILIATSFCNDLLTVVVSQLRPWLVKPNC